MIRQLFLFDIDGTLLSPGSVSRKSLDGVIRDMTGISPQLGYDDVAGLTDPLITRKALQKIGLKDGDLSPLVSQVLGAYIHRLKTVFPASGEPCVYADGKALLERVVQAGHGVGVLTGNMRASAAIKLGRFGLANIFPFGVYGDDTENRMEMPPIARDRAREIYGESFRFEDMVIVGDTAHDAKAASKCNAKSIIVCRRPEYREKIMAQNPTQVVDTFSDAIIT